MMDLRAAGLALSIALWAAPAWAQDSSCPGARTNDDCDRILFERMDRELTRTFEVKLTDIARRSTFADRVERARTSLSAAQREWLRFRDAECEAQAAVQSLISARTLKGLTAQCLYSVTKQRIEELSRF